MKTIILNIEERTLAQLNTALAVRGMAGQMAGIIEAALLKILGAIDEGATEVELKLKKESY